MSGDIPPLQPQGAPRTCIQHGERLAKIEESVENISKGIDQLNLKLDKSYIRREEFEPVKKLVYGAARVVLVGVLVAILGLVIISAGARP